MERLGWLLLAFGLMAAAASAYPFLYVMITTDDPTINPGSLGVLMACGGFAGLLVAAFGGSAVCKARTGHWPAGF
jgi:hypothetical protein